MKRRMGPYGLSPRMENRLDSTKLLASNPLPLKIRKYLVKKTGARPGKCYPLIMGGVIIVNRAEYTHCDFMCPHLCARNVYDKLIDTPIIKVKWTRGKDGFKRKMIKRTFLDGLPKQFGCKLFSKKLKAFGYHPDFDSAPNFRYQVVGGYLQPTPLVFYQNRFTHPSRCKDCLRVGRIYLIDRKEKITANENDLGELLYDYLCEFEAAYKNKLNNEIHSAIYDDIRDMFKKIERNIFDEDWPPRDLLNSMFVKQKKNKEAI
jgi:hypothetical protein